MRKLYSVLAIILFGAILCSCAAKLPEGMTEEKVKKSASNLINILNNKDYDAFNAECEQVLLDALADSALNEAWEPICTEAGSFDKIENTTVQASKGYAVAVVKAKYTNKSIVFTLSFNSDYKLGGIYFK